MVIDKSKIVKLLMESIQTNFADEGRPKWIKSRLAQLENRLTLTRTGRLRNSFTSTWNKDVLEISTKVFYGKFHQYGTKRLPARPFLMIQPEDVIKIKQIILTNIVSNWRNK